MSQYPWRKWAPIGLATLASTAFIILFLYSRPLGFLMFRSPDQELHTPEYAVAAYQLDDRYESITKCLTARIGSPFRGIQIGRNGLWDSECWRSGEASIRVDRGRYRIVPNGESWTTEERPVSEYGCTLVVVNRNDGGSP